MSAWMHLPHEIKITATRELTEPQLHAWMLHLAGCSQNRIAIMLNISRSTVRSRLDAADHKLRQHGITKDQHGNYYRKKAA